MNNNNNNNKNDNNINNNNINNNNNVSTVDYSLEFILDDAKSTEQRESVSNDTKTDEEKTASPPKTFKSTGLASKKSTFIKSFQSKYKHLLGELLHKDNNIENIRNLAESLPSESDGLQCYKDFLALPLSGPGGQIAVFQVSINPFSVFLFYNICISHISIAYSNLAGLSNVESQGFLAPLTFQKLPKVSWLNNLIVMSAKFIGL